MNRLLVLLMFLTANIAFAELPPPGTSRKGPITVTPQGRDTYTYDLERQAVINRADRAKVQRKLDDLRARVRDLEAENAALRNRPAPVAYAPVSRAPVETITRVETKKNRISGLAGWGPQSLTNRRNDGARGNAIAVENGPVVGGLYQRLVNDSISLGAGASVPTYADDKNPTYFGTLGFDF